MNAEWILVLGANSDMAVATARCFAKNGYNLYLASRNTDELEKEAAHLNTIYGVQVRTYFFDALKYDFHREIYSSLSPKPSGVILAFGILGDQELAQKDFTKAQEIIETNFSGGVSILECVAEDFENLGRGFIVAISSVAADRGRKSNYIYGSSKAGFSAYLSGLRHRLFSSGVTVLTVKPGFVSTKMTNDMDLPTTLTAQPQEVAENIFRAIAKGRNTIYVKPVWRLIMFVIIHLPEFIFKRTDL